MDIPFKSTKLWYHRAPRLNDQILQNYKDYKIRAYGE